MESEKTNLNSLIEPLVQSMIELTGCIAAAVVDIDSGETLARAGTLSAEVLEIAGVGNARLLRAQIGMAHGRQQQDVEDIVVSLSDEYHIIRLLRQHNKKSGRFLYLVLDRSLSTLALGRVKLAMIEKSISESVSDLRLIEIERDYVLDAQNLRTKVGRLELDRANTLYSSWDDEEPSYLRVDMALKLLGVKLNAVEIEEGVSLPSLGDTIK